MRYRDDITDVNNIRIKCEPKTFTCTLVQILRESHYLSDFSCLSIAHKFQITTFVKQNCVRSPWRLVSSTMWLIAVFLFAVSSILTRLLLHFYLLSSLFLLLLLFCVALAVAVALFLCSCCSFAAFVCFVVFRCCLLLLVTRPAWWCGDDGHDDSPASSTR